MLPPQRVRGARQKEAVGALAERDCRQGFINTLDRARCGANRLAQLSPGIAKP